MKLAFSNIGWSVHDDPAILDALRRTGVSGIEVAPTKVWPAWEGATPANATAYRTFLRDRGFEVPAMQAILFGRPELRLFDESESTKTAFVDHIRRVADLAQALGATTMVYGAPKSRLRGELSPNEALDRATDMFRILAHECSERDTCLCIEPNPPEYGCDFITNGVDALELVRRIDAPGFGLHLDAAALHMANDPVDELLPRALPVLRHFHISEPGLAGFDPPLVPHAENLARLRALSYANWVSVEVDGQKHDMTRTLAFLRTLDVR